MHLFDWIISTSVRCYILSAAVKVMVLLTLPAARASFPPRLTALLGDRHYEHSYS
jgi:hypothetical protein